MAYRTVDPKTCEHGDWNSVSEDFGTLFLRRILRKNKLLLDWLLWKGWVLGIL